jgi:hypothetical protein
VNGQLEAAWQLHRFLTARNIPYVVIDGLAVQRWGEPRLTIDVDLAILLPPGAEERWLREIAAAFPPRLKDAIAFALEHRVLPVDRHGDRLDVERIRRWTEAFARITDDREIIARFERAWQARSR